MRPGRRADLLRAQEIGRFGEGFPYGDLGEMLCAGRVDASSTVRWVGVSDCREYDGVAMHEELPHLEEFLTDIEVADGRSSKDCKGYPECNDCDCTRKVRIEGELLLDHLRRTAAERDIGPLPGRPTRWPEWRREVGPEEGWRNWEGRRERG